jgi:short-subunit dehydrogenase
VLSYGRALNKELQKKYGARVLCVCPFWTKTAFFDRAITAEQTQTVVKKYAAMYTPDQIVKRAWKDARKKKRDFSICGFTAKSQVLAVKLLPHRLVMWVWMKQQKL